MANTATNVSTGKPRITGGVWVAPRTASLPTDATSALSSDYKCLGYVSEDGVANSNELDTSEIKAWGGNIVYRSVNGMDDTFTLALMETMNTDVLKAVYGDSNVIVDGSGNIAVNVVAEEPQELIWVFEIVLRGGKAKRIVVPDGAITSRDEITYNDSDPITYSITVSAYPDASGKTHAEYIEAGSSYVTYTVVFNSNGGSAVAAQIVVSGETATEPTAPTKESYTFAGWYSDAELTTAFSFSTTITANMTLYAKWTENT